MKEFEGMAVKGAGDYFAIGLPPTLRDKAAKDGAPTVWVYLWKVKINRKGKSGGQECRPHAFNIPALRLAIGRATLDSGAKACVLIAVAARLNASLVEDLALSG